MKHEHGRTVAQSRLVYREGEAAAGDDPGLSPRTLEVINHKHLLR
jgi:hypothetical protein